MRAFVTSRWLPKYGNTVLECEDAYWPQVRDQVRGQELRFAVADGATESIFSRLWARRLVAIYCSPLTPLPNSNVDRFRERVEDAGRAWSRRVTSQSLPWHAWPKLERGSYASLVGLDLGERPGRRSTEDGEWKAFAVGDTCMFQVRDGELIAQHPTLAADQFGFKPLALSTHPGRNTAAWESAQLGSQRGEWRRGDTFLLMTDALAEWFVRNIESKQSPFPVLCEAAKSSIVFEEWITGQRDRRDMKNDDVTLMLIRP